jgi:uncharacterized membrane protein
MSSRSLSPIGALVIALGACQGGGGDGGVTIDQPHFTIALSVTPNDVSIPIGSTRTLAVSLVRGGGYAGVVNFTVDGLPSYVTATFQPPSLAGTASQSTLTLTTNDQASVGTYPIVIRASGDVVSEQRVTVNCTLMREPGFTLTPSASALTVVQNGSGQVSVGIARSGGFTGSVNLTVDGAPTGVTPSFAPNPATGDQSVLTLAAAPSAAPGTYALTIRGTGTGAPERTVALTLTVLEAVGYSLSLSTSTLSVTPPNTGTVTINIQRAGGFAGAVALAVEGYPTGTNATVLPSPTTGNTATLTLTTTIATPAGTYSLFVRGEADGHPVQRVPLQLTIQPVVGYLLTISNPQMTLTAGGSAQTMNIGIQRTGGFTGAVTFSLTGLPGGFTSSFSPATTTGTSSVLQISATTAVAPGSYTGVVTGTAAGLADRTTTISVTVIASGTSIAWRFCSASPQPVFFAYQDGTGPYNAVSPVDGSYPISLASGRGAVIWVLPTLPKVTTDAVHTRGPRTAAYKSRAAKTREARSVGARSLAQASSGYTTYVQYGTTSELQAFAQPSCPSGVTKSVSGSVANIGAGQGFGVGLGTAFYLGLPGTSTSYTLTDVPDGAHDLLSGRVNIDMSGDLVFAVPDRMILRRNQNPSNGSVLPLLDFATAEAFGPVTSQLTLTGTNGAEVELSGAFSTANGTYAFINGGEHSTSTNWTYFGIPSSRLIAGDLHWIIAGDDQGRTAVVFAHDIVPRTLAMGPVINSPFVSVFATSPVVRMRAQLTLGQPDTEYGGSFEATFIQTGLQRAFVMAYSRGAIGSSTSQEIRTPVLTGLPGWDESRYGFQTGAQVTWMITQWSTADTYVPVDGGLLRYVTFQGVITP